MEGDNAIGKSNPDQLKIVDEIIEELKKQKQNPKEYKGKALLLDGPGGNGKTFTLETIYAYCNRGDNQHLVLCSAYSGNTTMI